eukprot:8634998-Pyramimonas_sp.AAC.2
MGAACQFRRDTGKSTGVAACEFRQQIERKVTNCLSGIGSRRSGLETTSVVQCTDWFTLGTCDSPKHS